MSADSRHDSHFTQVSCHFGENNFATAQSRGKKCESRNLSPHTSRNDTTSNRLYKNILIVVTLMEAYPVMNPGTYNYNTVTKQRMLIL